MCDRGTVFLELLEGSLLLPHALPGPTRVTQSGSSAPDHIFTTAILEPHVDTQIVGSASDHAQIVHRFSTVRSEPADRVPRQARWSRLDGLCE
eukprot:5968231-Amphidinium_carterae.1